MPRRPWTMTTRSDWLRAVPRGLIDALLPVACPATGQWVAGGGEPTHPLITKHLDQVADIPYCPRCARSAPLSTLYDHRCGSCRDETRWNLKAIVRLGPYSPVLRKLLLDLKFHGHPQTAEILGRRMAQRLAEQPWIGDVTQLIPVPMHWIRRWQRPDNHAAVLARQIARHLQIPLSKAVRQRRPIASQVTKLTREAKMSNVRDSFLVRGSQPFAGQTVCLIDNLITSGATLIEMSRVVRMGGAERIYAAVAARAGAPAEHRDQLWMPDEASH